MIEESLDGWDKKAEKTKKTAQSIERLGTRRNEIRNRISTSRKKRIGDLRAKGRKKEGRSYHVTRLERNKTRRMTIMMRQRGELDDNNNDKDEEKKMG